MITLAKEGSTSSASPAELVQRARRCPAWCIQCIEDFDPRTHPDDRGVWHRGRNLADFTLGDHGPVDVHVDGFRHSLAPRTDWPDQVVGELGGALQFAATAPEARRLARAMLVAADLADGGENR